ncbi:hypothetical protein [Paracoccus spongiarum]|uniref:Uncharacterized protein n=1 Tax=Paracoccus spongiarum TaxID=3064387 RepID=A0ABT9J7Y3_9RHOB|nr:hypothetical protein [Paracoccus sp. 2205BS29-5]MDP5305923.1 hypothetical protein [Paracoccus sp. 2205BS29-5]
MKERVLQGGQHPAQLALKIAGRRGAGERQPIADGLRRIADGKESDRADPHQGAVRLAVRPGLTTLVDRPDTIARRPPMSKGRERPRRN